MVDVGACRIGTRVLTAVAVLTASLVLGWGAPAGAVTVGDPLLPDPLDCVDWRYDGVEPGPLPEEWDPDDDLFTSARHPSESRSPQQLCGQMGAAVDLAWGIGRGAPDVVIAVLDSGIRWRDRQTMVDLAAAAYLNRGELPVPQPRGGSLAPADDPHDANGDGRFSILDYADDARVVDRNGNERLDPEDLILTPGFSDGVDDDGNGFVDDISGWDFLEDDNNPLDAVDYGHGSGEARDAVAAHDGTGAFGTCPECMFVPVRVSDSFIAEGGRFAAGVLFALDSGADVVLDALGAVTNPPQAQQAIDAAHRRGLPIVASMADEQSQHANLPAALNHTIAVNSVTEALDFLGDVGTTVTGRRDTLALNGCTNTGAIAWITVPSDSCSSEATGNSAGVVGLLEATARQAGVAPHPDLVAAGVTGPGANVLSSDEVAQLLRATADDIDQSTPSSVDPANRTTDPYGQKRFPTVKGWDATFGYGRLNAYEVLKAVAAGEIPPEADITSPRWFATEGVAGTLAIEGRVAAVRSTSYDYRVEWTTGLQTPPYPAVDEWRTIASASGLTEPVDGVLAQVDLASIAAALPGGGRGTPTDAAGKPDPDRFTVRLRVVVTDAQGRVATIHRHLSVHDDPEAMAVAAPSGLGASSPAFADVDGDGADELVVGSDDGRLHVLRPDGTQLPGFPVATPRAAYWHDGPTAVADGIVAPSAAIGVGAVAVADLDGAAAGDPAASPELVVADFDGGVHVWTATGELRASVRTNPAFSLEAPTDKWNRLKTGIVGSPSLGDLDGDGDVEVVVAAMDRHVYAWHADGTPVAGFPVLVVDPTKVAAVDPVSHVVTFAEGADQGIGGELVATPAVGDLDGDGRAEIVIGAQEQYLETVAAVPPIGLPGTSGNTRLYAISPDGTGGSGPERSAAHPHEQAYLRGWPVALPMLLTDVLPTIGDGVAAQAAIGDVDGDGEPEVVASSVSGQTRVLDADGTSPYYKFLGMPIGLSWLNAAGPGTISPGTNSTDTGVVVSAFGGPALGRIGSATDLDVVAPTSGLGRALDTLFTNDQPGDPHLTVWSGRDGSIRPGFPRVTADIAFFVTPAVIDVDGDGRNEAVAGNGLHLLDAFGASGTSAAGWPKLTGGWTVGTPGAGDWDGDGRGELAVVRRDGLLQVWRLPTDASALGDWVRFGADDRNSGTVAAS